MACIQLLNLAAIEKKSSGGSREEVYKFHQEHTRELVKIAIEAGMEIQKKSMLN